MICSSEIISVGITRYLPIVLKLPENLLVLVGYMLQYDGIRGYFNKTIKIEGIAL